VGGRRPSTALEVVLQTPGEAPPADRLATTHGGFVIRELSGFDVGDLNAVLRDLDRDGTYEIVMPQLLGGFEGASRPQATIPEVFSWKDGDYAKVSARYPEFYREEVLPRLERQLQRLEELPPTADPSDRTGPSARSMRARSRCARSPGGSMKSLIAGVMLEVSAYIAGLAMVRTLGTFGATREEMPYRSMSSPV
jgi:hypothetical protein